MKEDYQFEDDEVILDEVPALEQEEDLLLGISTMQTREVDGEFRGFGIQEGGPSEAQDEERKFIDTVIGMRDPRILETHEIDEIEDHRLVPRSYHHEFAEYLQKQQDRMGTGAIDNGREVAVGSYMSPSSVLRMLIGLEPIDIFSVLDTANQEIMPVSEILDTIEVNDELVSNQVCRILAVSV